MSVGDEKAGAALRDTGRKGWRVLLFGWRRFARTPLMQAGGRAMTRLLEAGTAGYPPDVKRRLMIVNFIAYLIALTTAIYAAQQATLDYATYAPLIWLNVGLVMLGIVVPLSHRLHEIAGGLILVGAEYVALYAIMALLGRDSGVHIQFMVVAAAAFVVLGLERIRLVLAIVALALVVHLVTWFRFPQSAALIAADQRVIDEIYVQAAITTMALIGASVWYAFALVEQARGETERLLRNILPASIVDRVKAAPGEIIADSYDGASVLFADISGFVALSRRLGPAGVVTLLNDIVREFDALAQRHGVEKIKTIGDAYMAVAGLPERTPDHVARAVAMAHAMIGAVERIEARLGLGLKIRVGIASGPVMAGVIGTQKFSYDVWGDTVNLASRLEGQAEPGRVLICPACREALGEGFAFEDHGTIEIKGLGPQPTWYVLAA